MKPTSPLITRTMASPVGTLLLAWNDSGLYAVTHADLAVRLSAFGSYLKKNGLTVQKAAASDRDPYVSALQRYFGGETNALAGLPVVLLGTVFQLKVWNALRAIPLGETSSYISLSILTNSLTRFFLVNSSRLSPTWVFNTGKLCSFNSCRLRS